MLPLFLFIVCTTFAFSFSVADSMPFPWTRELQQSSPAMEGTDVFITQNLLKRDSSVPASLVADSIYGSETVNAVKSFQAAHKLQVTGNFDAASASALIVCCSDDDVKDTGFTARSMGYKYKISIPVASNRSVETIGTLFDADNNILVKFHARAHGHRDDGVNYPWPDFGSNPPDDGLNEFTSSGNTVTGLIEIDLNSPESNAQLYGPWPVNRFVKGISGNAEWILPNIRDGILLHTGNWTTAEHGVFDPLTMDMPNSSGCVHSHPSEVEAIYKALINIGVEIHENPFSGKNYPFKPQGIAVVYSSPSVVPE